MNILILHHFSNCWDQSFKYLGTDYEKELEKVLDYLKNENVDKVIITSTQSTELEDCHQLIKQACEHYAINVEIYKYGFGWLRNNKELKEKYPEEDKNKTWCYGERDCQLGEDIVLIEQWQHDLKGNNIRVAGAFENECILDLTTALESIGVGYTKERGMIIGVNDEYEFRDLNKTDLEQKLNFKLNKLEKKITIKSQEHKNLTDIYILKILILYMPLREN